MPRLRLLLGLLSATLVVPVGCTTTTDCTPTSTTAEDADKIDLTAPGRSSTLEAQLSSLRTAEPVSGRKLYFSVMDDGAEVYAADGTTGADGKARIDLKRVDTGSLQALARGDEFRASFGGDAEYCASSDDAAFRVVKAPAGVNISAGAGATVTRP